MKKILILIILVSFSIWGKPDNSLAENRRVDNEPTRKEINEFKRKTIRPDSYDGEKTLEELEKGGNTKGQANFSYLDGYNLSYSSFDKQVNEDDYGTLFYNNYFIPQGLTKDYQNNLLISMYDIHNIYYSIIVRYNPASDTILDIYKLNDMNHGAHVGGIGYYKNESSYKEFIFVSNGSYINLYQLGYNYYYNSPITFIESFLIGYQTSTVSTSYNYLWIAKFVNDSTNSDGSLKYPGPKYVTGYEINWDEYWEEPIIDNNGYLGNAIKPNYRLLQPKDNIQGLYCDSDPRVDKRLKFYFSRGQLGYIYQATLVSKDIDNNGWIVGNHEYKWESFFTPNEADGGNMYRELPLGPEGIIKIGTKIYILNEAGSEYFCDDIGSTSWDSNIDCAREILVVDSIDNGNGFTQEIFPSGSIRIKGSGLDNWGYKVAVIFAQNKLGQLYYTIGEFSYIGNSTSFI